jgi:hypothetical protein
MIAASVGSLSPYALATPAAEPCFADAAGRDNVAIVANVGGQGTRLSAARPIATVKPPAIEPLEGYTFEGYRNRDGSVGTRNILAITTTVQCVAGVVAQAVARIKAELLPRYPNVDDVIGLEHSYGCGVAIDAPDAVIPIRTLKNISLNPNFGGEVMVVSLGCEKLQPARLLPPGSFPDHRRARPGQRPGDHLPAGRRSRGLHVHARRHPARARNRTWSASMRASARPCRPANSSSACSAAAAMPSPA